MVDPMPFAAGGMREASDATVISSLASAPPGFETQMVLKRLKTEVIDMWEEAGKGGWGSNGFPLSEGKYSFFYMLYMLCNLTKTEFNPVWIAENKS